MVMAGIEMIECGIYSSLVPFQVLGDAVEDADGFEEGLHNYKTTTMGSLDSGNADLKGLI